jgi:hypothetical protein
LAQESTKLAEGAVHDRGEEEMRTPEVQMVRILQYIHVPLACIQAKSAIEKVKLNDASVPVGDVQRHLVSARYCLTAMFRVDRHSI